MARSLRKRGIVTNTKIRVPKTKRYCLLCEDICKFVYNPSIGHSECFRCGQRFAIKLDREDTIQLLVKEIQKKGKNENTDIRNKLKKYFKDKTLEIINNKSYPKERKKEFIKIKKYVMKVISDGFNT